MNGLKTIFWTVCLAVLYLILNTHCRGYDGIGRCIVNRRKVCCSSFEWKNGTCTRCLIGFNSEINSKCKQCTNGMYGRKCGKTCSCNSNERCHHVHGCIFDGQTTNRNYEDTDFSYIKKSTPSVKGKEESDIIISITLRELIFIIIIILLSLFILYGLLQKYRKRQKRALINPLDPNEEETNEFRREHQEVEERTESVYNEIDESAMNTLPSRKSFHHSYLEITNSPSSTIHTIANSTSNSICSSPRLYSAKGSTNDLHISIGSEYSDGYLRPMFIAQLQSMNTRIKPQGTVLSSNNNVIRIQNDGYVYKESTYAGIGRSMSYNKLMLKDGRNQAHEIGFVDNPIYHDTVHQHPKYATWSSKRKTI